jgi:hypothetical protein
MKVPKRIAAIILALLLASISTKAMAVPVRFNPDLSGEAGQVSVKMPLEKIGSVSVPRGRLRIKGNLAEVSTVEEFQFDHQVVLSGPVLNTRQHVEKGKLEITGTAYFSEGDWLTYLSPPVFDETLSTTSGDIHGKILSIDSETAVVRTESGQQEKIPVASINEIHSPRAFSFAISAVPPLAVPSGQPYETDATRVALTQTAHQFRAFALRSELRKNGDGDLTRGQLIAVGTAISAIEIGQMVPFIVVPLLYNHLSQEQQRREFAVLTSPININSSIGVPNYLVPPPRGVLPSPNLTPPM